MGKVLAGPLVQDSAGVLFGSLVDPATGTTYAPRARNLTTAATGDTAAQEVVVYDIAGNPLMVEAGNADGQTGIWLLATQSRLMAYNGTTWDRLRSSANKYLWSDLALDLSAQGDGVVDAGASGTGRVSNGGAPGYVGVRSWLFNGSTWDRPRNNTEGTLLASAARTASTNSPVLTNPNGDAITLHLFVSANPGGAETLTINFYSVDPVTGGVSSPYASFTTAAATNAHYRFMLGKGCSGTPINPAVNKAVELMVPRTILVQITHSGAGSWTYSLGYQLNTAG